MKYQYVCGDCGYSHVYSFGNECPNCGSSNIVTDEATQEEMTEADISTLIARELGKASNE